MRHVISLGLSWDSGMEEGAGANSAKVFQGLTDVCKSHRVFLVQEAWQECKFI